MAMDTALSNLRISNHPLVRHKLAHMRGPGLSSQQFYRLMKEVGMLLAHEVTADLANEPDEQGQGLGILTGRKPAIVPVLRSGLAMAEGMREVMPSFRTGHLGLLQDENHQPREYLIALPKTAGRIFIVVDAVIATGNNAMRAIEILKDYHAEEENILFCVLMATDEGARGLLDAHPKARIYAGHLGTFDHETKKTVPYFGDVGNRLFFGDQRS